MITSVKFDGTKGSEILYSKQTMITDCYSYLMPLPLCLFCIPMHVPVHVCIYKLYMSAVRKTLCIYVSCSDEFIAV